MTGEKTEISDSVLLEGLNESTGLMMFLFMQWPFQIFSLSIFHADAIAHLLFNDTLLRGELHQQPI